MTDLRSTFEQDYQIFVDCMVNITAQLALVLTNPDSPSALVKLHILAMGGRSAFRQLDLSTTNYYTLIEQGLAEIYNLPGMELFK